MKNSFGKQWTHLKTNSTNMRLDLKKYLIKLLKEKDLLDGKYIHEKEDSDFSKEIYLSKSMSKYTTDNISPTCL
jgi:hypothetical protein